MPHSTPRRAGATTWRTSRLASMGATPISCSTRSPRARARPAGPPRHQGRELRPSRHLALPDGGPRWTWDGPHDRQMKDLRRPGADHMLTISDTVTEMVQWVFPEHAGAPGQIHGGRMMQWIATV